LLQKLISSDELTVYVHPLSWPELVQQLVPTGSKDGSQITPLLGLWWFDGCIADGRQLGVNGSPRVVEGGRLQDDPSCPHCKYHRQLAP
jgi:hypothetical protein